MCFDLCAATNHGLLVKLRRGGLLYMIATITKAAASKGFILANTKDHRRWLNLISLRNAIAIEGSWGQKGMDGMSQSLMQFPKICY